MAEVVESDTSGPDATAGECLMMEEEEEGIIRMTAITPGTLLDTHSLKGSHHTLHTLFQIILVAASCELRTTILSLFTRETRILEPMLHAQGYYASRRWSQVRCPWLSQLVTGQEKLALRTEDRLGYVLGVNRVRQRGA